MTIYDIGSGETYETYTALIAAVTLQPNDEVDGLDNEFTELWSPNANGTNGSHILHNNADVDGTTNSYTLSNVDRSYLTFDNMIFRNGTTRTIRGQLSVESSMTDITFSNIEIYNASQGMFYRDTHNLSISNATVYDPSAYGFVLGFGGSVIMTGLSLDNLSTVFSVTGSPRRGLWIVEQTSPTISNCSVIKGNVGYYYDTVDGGELSNLSADGSHFGFTYINCLGSPTISGLTTSDTTSNSITFTDCSFTDATLSDTTISTSALNGLVLDNVQNITLNIGAINNASSFIGFLTLNACSGIVLNDYEINDCAEGFSINDTTSITLNRCLATGNGDNPVGSTGDGFTSHDTSHMVMNFCVARLNKNTGFATVGATTGQANHATFYNNHDEGARASLWLDNGSGAGWVVRNCIIVNTTYTEDPTNGGKCVFLDSFNSMPVARNNIYWSDNEAVAFEVGTTVYDDFDAYVAAGRAIIDENFELGSTFQNPSILTTGRLLEGSPAIGTALKIDGINDYGTDGFWGVIIGNPNIGADQSLTDKGVSMGSIVITENGDYVLPDRNSQARQTSATTVLIRSNTATAVLTFGYGDIDDNFVAFNNGVISTDDIITHGRGCKLMVNASGISSGEVTIFNYPVGG